MKLTKLIIFSLLFMLMSASSCSGTKYVPDKGALPPFQADVMEFPVKVNRNICKDMSGSIGACTLMITHRNDLKIEIMPQAYAYNIHITCSSSINYEYSNDIPKEKSHVVEITKDVYEDVSHFVCIGKMTPQGRDFVSARWEVRIRVSDENYVSRVNGFLFDDKGKWYLSLGKHSKYAWVFDKGEWRLHKKKPIIRIKGDPTKVKAYSESHIMRFNFFNM